MKAQLINSQRVLEAASIARVRQRTAGTWCFVGTGVMLDREVASEIRYWECHVGVDRHVDGALVDDRLLSYCCSSRLSFVGNFMAVFGALGLYEQSTTLV